MKTSPAAATTVTVPAVRARRFRPNPVPGCEPDPVWVYVDPETFDPLQTERPHGYVNPPGGRLGRFGIASRYLTFECLPGTAGSRALADIRAQHPDE